MNELVKRLRNANFAKSPTFAASYMHEAADEIERLRGILEEIATFTSDPVAEHAAREALGPLSPAPSATLDKTGGGA